jgi:hypothetical protein
VDSAEIVVREVQRDGSLQMRELFAERIGEPPEPAKLHPHGQILSFDKAGRNVFGIGCAIRTRHQVSSAVLGHYRRRIITGYLE